MLRSCCYAFGLRPTDCYEAARADASERVEVLVQVLLAGTFDFGTNVLKLFLPDLSTSVRPTMRMSQLFSAAFSCFCPRTV